MLIAWIYNIVLAIIHFFANRIVVFQNIPRSIWLSIAGGASISYIFLHLLPELSAYQEYFTKNSDEMSLWGDKYVYAIALIGLIIFYGLERLVKMKKKTPNASISHNVFWLHISTYFIYNFLVGYLLISEIAINLREASFFFVAMAFHFVVNDFSLLQDHKEMYIKRGRWFITAAIICGGIVASFLSLHEHLIIVLFGLISGSVILNVLKEELPEERKSRFWAFCTGALAYSVLLILTEE